MDTIVTANVISEYPTGEVRRALERALGWFGEVERVCSRFERGSEVFRLAERPGEPMQVSRLLFEAVRFGLEVARASGGIFDPTVGAAQAKRGFDRSYISGEHVTAAGAAKDVSWRDVEIDQERQTIVLRKPLLFDLGAVVKGMAIDLAAQELAAFESFSIDAGGDVYVKGANERQEPWHIGVQHPRADGVIATLQVTEGAVCTSGDYVRRASSEGEHHLLDPRSGASPCETISCTVVAPTAMAADALSTAAFVAGPDDGLRLLEEQGVEGMFVTPSLEMRMTAGFGRLLV